MIEKTNNKKVKLPFGLITEIANRAQLSTQAVGVGLGLYENSTSGVSKENKALILAIAKEVAQEKVIEYGEFIDSLKLQLPS